MFRFWLSRVLHYFASLLDGSEGWTQSYTRLNFSDGPQVYVWKFKMDKIKETDSYWITEVGEPSVQDEVSV